MKTSIFTTFDVTIPFPRVLSMIRQAGFESVALGASAAHSGYDTESGRVAIRRLLDANGLAIDSMHAPFPQGDQLFALDESKRRESIRQCVMAMDAARELGVGVVAIHLIQPYDIPHGTERDQMIAVGLQSVGELAGHAAKTGVKVAVENGQRRDYDEVLEKCLEECSPDCVGFCYDSGHENVQGTGFRLLEKFGDRLLTVHLHDNLGSDTHVLPYEGSIDWERFREVFHAIRYPGNLVLEVDVKHSRHKDPEVFLAEARKCAEKLRQPPAASRGV